MKKLIVVALIIGLGYQLFMKDSPALKQEISLTNQSIYTGQLLLINKQSKLQQDPTNLAPIPTDLANNVLVDSDYLIDQAVLEPLQQMFKAAESDDIYHFKINSAYRSGKLQQQLYEKNGAQYALPSGYSEHQTGLSLDIGSTQGTMDNTIEGEWLANHAADFGFVLRYPENKADITGIAFEPWHFRYVGLPHSIVMQQKDLALEEYITFLKQEKQYTKKVDGVTYFVQYVEKTDVVKIPDTENFKLSGDNENGFIITSVVN